MRSTRFLIELRESIAAAFRALRANILRTVLTTLGIVVGVTAVIAIVSLIQGLDRTVKKEVAGLGTNVLYVGKYPWIQMDDFWKYRNRKNITMEQGRRLLELVTLPEAASMQVTTNSTVKWRERAARSVSIEGHTPEGRIVHDLDPEIGRFFTVAESRDKRNVIILGNGLWRDLFEERDPIGQRVRVGRHVFTVIGVMPEQGTMMGMDQNASAVIPLDTLMKLFGSRRSIGITLRAFDAESLQLVEDEARGLMRRIRGIPFGDEDDFAINRQEMLLDLFRSLTAALFAVMVGVASLSLLVGGIGIMNIMLVSVTERTREIGIRKSVGAKRRDIMWQFLVESVVVSGLGGIIGMGLGITIALVISAVTSLPASAPLWAVLLGLAFSTSVGLFFGIYPAAKAAGLDPIEALRFE
ncbi:ABC transporter permease [Candidatus Zixiibacteriota bacterium]